MVRTGPHVVGGWTGDELSSSPTTSPQSVRRSELITWFLRELHAESFICSYWSVGNVLKSIPGNLFGQCPGSGPIGQTA